MTSTDTKNPVKDILDRADRGNSMQAMVVCGGLMLLAGWLGINYFTGPLVLGVFVVGLSSFASTFPAFLRKGEVLSNDTYYPFMWGLITLVAALALITHP